jgi:hypothetical protein
MIVHAKAPVPVGPILAAGSADYIIALFCAMIWSMSDYKTDQDRLMDQLAEQAEYLAQEQRKNDEACDEYREKIKQRLATLGIEWEGPESPPEE